MHYDILASQRIMNDSRMEASGVPGVSESNVAGVLTPPNLSQDFGLREFRHPN